MSLIVEEKHHDMESGDIEQNVVTSFYMCILFLFEKC
jgi:hypothetical protein